MSEADFSTMTTPVIQRNYIIEYTTSCMVVESVTFNEIGIVTVTVCFN